MYLTELDEKINDMEKAIRDEKHYYNTMPQSIYLAKKA